MRKRLKKTGIHISDHAILRYLERVKKQDIKSVISEILTPEIQKQITTLGSNGIFTTAKFRVVVKQNVITTILPLHDSKRRELK